MANNRKEIKLMDVVKIKDSGHWGLVTEISYPFQIYYKIKLIRSNLYTFPINDSIVIAEEDEFEKLYSLNDTVRCKKDGKIGKLYYVGGFIAVKFDNGTTRIMDINNIEKVERFDHLVWNHNYANSENVLGHAIRKNKDDGIYVYCSFNDTAKQFNAPIPKITKVIFNYPATIVMWSDKTKTVVKCSKYDIYDHEKGLAMAICKKIFGDDYYEEIIKKYTKRTNEIEDILPYLTPFQMLQLSKIDKKRR